MSSPEGKVDSQWLKKSGILDAVKMGLKLPVLAVIGPLMHVVPKEMLSLRILNLTERR